MKKIRNPGSASLSLFGDENGESGDPGPVAPPAPRVLQVRELAEDLRRLIESSFRTVWVQGEISNLSIPRSGHWYFTLKDDEAQVPCVMFKGRNHLVRPVPRDGDAVLLRGQPSFYAAQGKAQIIVEHLEPAGEGKLLRAFEELKKKLAAEGLFEAASKREIPAVPRAIGIITSPTGAALQDMLTTLRRRFPLGSVFVYPVPVQGDAAAPKMVRALSELPRLAPVDVLILARGGGSLEDLWAFNDEKLARAIRSCAVPVVTGVGHETDFTIADLAADLRAPTPTGAAERVAPDVAEWREQLDETQESLGTLLAERLHDAREALARAGARFELVHPGRRLEQFAQRLDELTERLAHATPDALSRRRGTLDAVDGRLRAAHPARQAALLRLRLDSAYGRLGSRLRSQLDALRQRIRTHASLLDTLGPQGVLDRGYAIAQAGDGSVLRDPATLREGDPVNLTLARGKVRTRVAR